MRYALRCLLVALLPAIAPAAIVMPAFTATDGAFTSSTNRVLDLSLASDGAWDSASTGNSGVYDKDQWAVVYKFSSVNITGGTLTFKNHRSGAPVIWLVEGNVTIGGTIALNGEAGRSGGEQTVPGPGGFSGANRAGAGYGPGGGAVGQGGSYRTLGVGAPASAIYGSGTLFPLMGGSGGGSMSGSDYNGGAGGGAILILAGGTITLNSAVRAEGGAGNWDTFAGTRSRPGSGGAIRLVASRIEGPGDVFISPGNGNAGSGGGGGVRLEAEEYDLTLMNFARPSNYSYVVLPPGSAPKAFLTVGGGAPDPYVRAIRLVDPTGTQQPRPIPVDPEARLSLPTDVMLDRPGQYDLEVDAAGIDSTWKVTARLIRPQSPDLTVQLDYVSLASGITHWKKTLSLETHVTAVQVRADKP